MLVLRRSQILVSFMLLAGSVLAVGLSPSPATAQERDGRFPRVSPNATVNQTIGATEVRITYGRPSVRGRTIFGGLVPYDEVWRAGANEATTITFQHDVQIEGQPLAAGTYGLFTIPGRDTWTVIFNGVPNQWGAYEYDAGEDVLRVEAAPESTTRSWEMMTFAFENVSDTEGRAILYWANTKVPFTISVDTPSIIRTAANEAARTAENWQAPFQYANYALQNEVLLEDALQWIDQSIDAAETFYNLAVKARLLAAVGDTGEAVSVGERAVTQGEAMDEAPNGLDDLRQQVASWRSQM